jgi:hypothetical protein
MQQMDENAIPTQKKSPLSLLHTAVLLGAFAAIISIPFIFSGDGRSGTIFLAQGSPAEQIFSTSLSSGQLVKLSVPVEGTVIDFAKGDLISAAIVQTKEGAFEVFTLTGIPTRVTRDGMRKESLAISPDGKWVAYAQLTDLDTSKVDLTSSWTIHVVNTGSGEIVPLGFGYAPQFFTRDGVLQLFFTSPNGLTLANPEEHTTSGQTFLAVGNATNMVTLISPDGRYGAMKNISDPGYILFEVEQLAPGLILNPIGYVTDSVSSVALVDDQLVGVVSSPEGQTLYAYSLVGGGEKKKLLDIPPSPIMMYLLP